MSAYELEVNGITYPVAADQSKNLLSVIREDVGLTGRLSRLVPRLLR